MNSSLAPGAIKNAKEDNRIDCLKEEDRLLRAYSVAEHSIIKAFSSSAKRMILGPVPGQPRETKKFPLSGSRV